MSYDAKIATHSVEAVDVVHQWFAVIIIVSIAEENFVDNVWDQYLTIMKFKSTFLIVIIVKKGIFLLW